MFATEKELFDTALQSSFIRNFHISYRLSTYMVEPRGLFGVPDLVIARVNDHLQTRTLQTFAFEMKLSNWTRAIVQAFRYRAFAMMSYVVLDHAFIARALRNINRFHAANIGLLSIERSGSVLVHHQPDSRQPYSPQLESTFQVMIRKHGVCENW